MSAGDNITLTNINTIGAGKMNIINTSTNLNTANFTANTSVTTKNSFELGQTNDAICRFAFDNTNTSVKVNLATGYDLILNREGNKVGIGGVPSYNLDVYSASLMTVNLGVGYTLAYYLVDSSYMRSGNSTNQNDVCSAFNGTIWCTSWIALTSDVRIKTNIQDIDDGSALQLIMKVEPKTYEYIDKIEKSDKRVYGFIAQQIQEVIPEAVITQPSVIPNIFKTGALTDSNVITMDTDISDTIKVDSNISLITSNLGKKEYKVTNVNSNQFTIDTNIDDSNNVFVYGTKVNDFHILDKNYIFTLNVCATQELYKLIKIQDQQILDLEQKCELLSNIINQQQIIIDNLKTS